MKNSLINGYLHYESKAIDILSRIGFLEEYMNDPISARITLFLIAVGTLAFINELYITIEMSFLQKETYRELNKSKLDESLKSHRMLLDDDFHSREILDEKSGIVIEEFEAREKFFAKPVHVAHLYVECDVIRHDNDSLLLSKPLKFHIEFSPEEYEHEKRPEFGCKLSVLRRKLYHFFKETNIYNDLVEDKGDDFQFTVSNNVTIYNRRGEPLPASVDSIQLCFLKIETGDTIKCKFVI